MFKKLANKIQEDIVKKNSLKLHFAPDKECTIVPRRLVFLDGELSIIGEEIHCKTLEFFPLNTITKIEKVETVYSPNLSQFQVNDFINNLRLMNGKQERLILKVHAKDGATFIPDYHYLHNPYVTANPEGDMIWAATIEMCDDIYQWLYTMRDKVEILDPTMVRKEFSKYCQFQKAS